MKSLSWWERLYVGTLEWIAWHLPRAIAYRVLIRCMAHATWVYSSIQPDEITIMDALEAWGREP